MGSTIEIPLWLALVAGLLGLAGLLDRVIGPSLRWVFRKRVNRLLERVNERLHLKIQPFKLTKRRVLVERLRYDPQVMEAVERCVQEEGVPRAVAVERVERYARETVPSFSAYWYFRIGARAARRVSEALYRVRVGRIDDAALRAVDPEAAVVFVMNHRSNMDYLLVTYLAAERSALSYAVGEWANVWGLRSIIRSMGAYFIRRSSNNPLYRKVVARYVKMATEGGVTQAVFPEGRLSRDGVLQPPKLGILSYITDGFEPGASRDIVFVPIGMNYDRVLEDRVLVRGAEGASVKVGPLSAARFFLRLLWLRLTRRLKKFGYACVSFGTPVSLREWLSDGRALDVEALGAHLMDEVAQVVPVLPVSLVAAELLEVEMPLATDALDEAVQARMQALEAAGAYVLTPRAGPAAVVPLALDMLRLRRLIVEDKGAVAAAPDAAPILRYYANAIGHLGA